MEMPKPIDPRRLGNILGGAKAIMDKVETGDYETGNVDGRALNEEGVQQMMAEGITRPQTAVAPQMQPSQPLYKNMETSKMPDAIKEAMMATPIPQVNGMMGHTFNLEDVQDQMPQTKRAPQFPQTPKTNPQPVYEQQQIGQNPNGTFTVSEAALRGIVKDVLLEFMANTFTQNLSEEVVKKTIQSLIKEGKIGVKKKATTKKVVRA
jgi:hypothetical protein